MLLAIDPGNIESAYVVMNDDYSIDEFAKVNNEEILRKIHNFGMYPTERKTVIEMVSSYGMAVGKEVFETVYWIGRFFEASENASSSPERILRKDVKLNLCGQAKAKDSNIIQALKDRFGDKGTKANPGWFYGFKADCWQAYALGVTYLDRRGDIQEVKPGPSNARYKSRRRASSSGINTMRERYMSAFLAARIQRLSDWMT